MNELDEALTAKGLNTWNHQYSHPSGLYLARRVFEDVRSLKYIGIDGYVEDGSQRSFGRHEFEIERCFDHMLAFRICSRHIQLTSYLHEGA